MKIAICEDEELLAKKLWNIFIDNPDMEAEYFTHPLDLLKKYENGERYHILFCDAAMKPINGIQLCRLLRKYDKNMYIVFVTNYSEYAPEGYEIGLFRYLLKPITSEKIEKVMQEISADMQKSTRVLLKTPECSLLVKEQDILYIEAENKSSCIFYGNDSLHVGKGLGEMEQLLSPYSFFRTHRKYLVNLERIQQFDQYHVTLDNGRTLPVSRRKAVEFKKAIYQFLGER